jgi:hypothetical protein
MFSWGTFQQILVIKKKLKKKKKAVLHLCVCPTWFKETGGRHSVRRSRVPTSLNKFPNKTWMENNIADKIKVLPKNSLQFSNFNSFQSLAVEFWKFGSLG